MTFPSARNLTDEARAAGLEEPRVMPYRTRAGLMQFKVLYGKAVEGQSRPFVVIEPRMTIADAVKLLKEVAGG